MNPDEDRFTCILLGKIGSGKSRTGNTILGKIDCFEFSGNGSVQTTECRVESRKCVDDTLFVVDTPGIHCFGKADYEEIKNFLEEKNLDNMIYIVCVQVGRLTDEEIELLKQYGSYFGKTFYERAIIVFTHLDDWEENMLDVHNITNPSIDQFISSLPELSYDILDKFGRRVIAVNNRKTDNESFIQNIFQMAKYFPLETESFIEEKSSEYDYQDRFLSC